MVIRRKVKKVIDGDTFETCRRIQGSNRVRIAGKNSPERHQKGGSRATQALKRKIQGETVTLKPVGRSYGRVVAKVRHKRRLIK
jgi:endonuclease YncB( thermonuclease family)